MGIYSDFLSYFEILSSSPQKCGTKSYSVSDLSYLADSIIYSNDAGSLFGTMFLFFLYVLLFYRGTFMEKLSVMLVFYPALIAINYLMLDTGVRLFKIVTQASYEEALQSSTLMLTSTAIHTVSLLLRLLFWIGAWLVLRRFLEKIPSHLNIKTWLIIDMLILEY